MDLFHSRFHSPVGCFCDTGYINWWHCMVKLTWEQCIPSTVTGYVNCDDIVWLNLHGNKAFRPLFVLWFICFCGYIPQWKGLQVISFNPFSAKQCLLWCHFLPRPVSETEQINLIGSLWKLCCAGKCTGEVELQQLEVMLKPSDETHLFRVKKKKKNQLQVEWNQVGPSDCSIPTIYVH